MGLFSTPGADNTPAGIAFNGIQQLINSKAFIALYSWLALTYFDKTVIGGIAPADGVRKQFLDGLIPFAKVEADFG